LIIQFDLGNPKNIKRRATNKGYETTIDYLHAVTGYQFAGKRGSTPFWLPPEQDANHLNTPDKWVSEG
jgi:hypothetical protein